jgi:hypothetical protein
MRLLVVIGDELLGGNEARDWAFLESLVAANSPERIELEVLALINEPGRSVVFTNPLGRAVGQMAADGGSRGSSPVPHDAADSARQRLGRAGQHLRSLGIRATGEVATGDTYRLVRRKVEAGSYDRVLLLLSDRRSPIGRLTKRSIEARLRRVLNVSVQAVGQPQLAPPDN